MKRSFKIEKEIWPIAGTFTISRGSKTAAEVIVCSIEQDGSLGHSECVPYARYGETLESVTAQLEAVRLEIENGADLRNLTSAIPACAARNALDCAVWDLEAKLSNEPVYRKIYGEMPRALTTAITISIGSVEEMAAAAENHSNRDLIKVKLGTDDDISRMRAVAKGAPNSRIIVDANEGWNQTNLQENLNAAAEYGIALVEQPLPDGEDELLRELPHPVPICADESSHTSVDLEKLVGKYDAVNIKLDKTGGLTEALLMREKAHAMGFSVMVGCMVGTSLAMAPAVLLAQKAEFVDLDGPLLLQKDRQHGLTYASSMVSPPSPKLWG